MESRLLEACREALAAQLAPRAQIIDAGCPGRDRCDLLLERSTGEGQRARLVIDLAPARACIYLGHPVPTESAADPFHRALIGRWIVGVDRPASGPVLRLSLQSPGDDNPAQWLVLEWLGGRPDAILVDARSQTVLATLRDEEGSHAARRGAGATYRWPLPPRRPLYGEATEEEVAAILASAPSGRRERELSRGFADLPIFLAHEAAARGAGDAAQTAQVLHEIARAPLDVTLYRIKDAELDFPAVFVSPIPLPSLEVHRSARTGSLFHLLEHAHEAVLRVEEEATIRASFLRLLGGEEQRLIRLHKRLAAESEEAAKSALWRRQAEALLIHLDAIPRRAGHFSCPDPADPKATLSIDLDPAASIPTNAERLFRLARRGQRAAPIRRRRLKALEEVIAGLSILRQRTRREGIKLAQKGGVWLRETLGRFAREPAIAAWERRITTRVAPAGERPKRPAPRPPRAGPRREERFHPRRYKTADGWIVLVGRSNAENDHVTHVLAKADDYWFHAEGCAGSHVVLRREGRKDNPSARTIQETAAIAAYFSKARTSKKAPVVYTLKKHVRRPRKGAPGLALVTHEKMIMVEPKAPEAGDPGGWGDEEDDR